MYTHAPWLTTLLQPFPTQVVHDLNLPASRCGESRSSGPTTSQCTRGQFRCTIVGIGFPLRPKRHNDVFESRESSSLQAGKVVTAGRQASPTCVRSVAVRHCVKRYRGRDSNPHVIKTVDFKSTASAIPPPRHRSYRLLFKFSVGPQGRDRIAGV